ncbi:MAG: CDP-diacylglycerol--serine O-phosphatidyltransferase, partial [Alloprevotella sp.]|nr:CDP-diacylglycerol--serine O-phosphatidyltransferase [Alloprevotella sp.]
AAFLMAAFSALRLAKFNLDERQALGFIGLPTPANALFWGSLSLLAGGGAAAGAAWLPWVLLGLVALSCWLLVCEVPMFALKFKHYGLRGNEVRYGFILFSAAALIVGGRSAFVAIVPCYVVLSVFLWLIKNK